MRGDLRRSIIFIVILPFLHGVAFSQKENYPKNYFSLPVYPGQANTLSGALGDLRTSHFHAGIDVRTQRREGLPITAAADGYVSRIVVQRAGYGKAVYVTHPNGMTTVYAHLQKFNKEIGDYVREEQYKKQTFEINLTPEEGRFPVKRKEVIAISGNTGSSEGPHLHFEIRDSRNNYLNPLFFGFPEIKDNTPPRFVDIALSPADINSRVNGRIDRQVFTPSPQKSGNIFSIKDTIRATGTLHLELQAFDRMDGTGFNYGLNCIEVKIDGQEIFAFNMEKFPVDVGRDYNYLVNYKARVEDRKRYYKCYNPQKNTLNIYRTDENRGRLKVQDDEVRLVQIRIFDSFENWSELKFYLRGEQAPTAVSPTRKSVSEAGILTENLGDMIKMTASETNGTGFENGREYPLEPAYSDGVQQVFLWNLQNGCLDSVRIGQETKTFGFAGKIPPNSPFDFRRGDLAIGFGERSLFDTLYLHSDRVGNVLNINDRGEPLRGAIEITYRPLVDDTLKDKTHIYRLINGRNSFVGGEWNGSEIRFTTRELGTFHPLTDLVPPEVRVLQSTPRLISARISDDLSGISSFKARVNGEWVLMNYEYKNNYIWSVKVDDTIPFEGELELEVIDNAGNVKVVSAKIAEPRRR